MSGPRVPSRRRRRILVVEDAVALLDRAEEPPVVAEATEIDLHERQQERRPRAELQHALRGPDHLLQTRALEAEHRPDDDAEGDVLHRLVERERHAVREGVDRVVGDVEHRLPVDLHPLSVERREKELPLPAVLLAVDHEHGAIAEQRRERLVEAAGLERLAVVEEDLLHVLGVGEDHELEPEQAHREGLAEVLREPIEVGIGSAQPLPRAPRRGVPRGRRKAHDRRIRLIRDECSRRGRGARRAGQGANTRRWPRTGARDRRVARRAQYLDCTRLSRRSKLESALRRSRYVRISARSTPMWTIVCAMLGLTPVSRHSAPSRRTDFAILRK